MSFIETISYFKSLNVCRVQNWNEVRIKGKLLRTADIKDQVVKSKWCYRIEVVD